MSGNRFSEREGATCLHVRRRPRLNFQMNRRGAPHRAAQVGASLAGPAIQPRARRPWPRAPSESRASSSGPSGAGPPRLTTPSCPRTSPRQHPRQLSHPPPSRCRPRAPRSRLSPRSPLHLPYLRLLHHPRWPIYLAALPSARRRGVRGRGFRRAACEKTHNSSRT